ncbi:protocatechuate 3,4-dioxygenase [Variovorax sp. PCZ-1]|uniref:dioxygenase family protein n=1 Tax=Variovorax sp. PCZ-1 TaxID=2835533 RepID=UPI001BCE6CCC|nr:protocatechuate 3,4-dioxygenase [Variovorax sp. PCZ-1]MBS7808677.1 intradiol ring-cleavage dioxygenase [Variovorax sp. PCZ-1]
MTTTIARRSALKLSALAASSVVLPTLLLQAAIAQTSRKLTPSQSEGPFYPDQQMQDADADLLKNGRVAYTAGQSAWVSGVVSDMDGKPVSGALVEIWQCDHEGVYRHSRSSGNAPMAFQGFGKVQVGADGRYRFRTIKPVPYTGRPPHIHMKIKLGSRELLTTQMYVAGDASNARDFLTRSLGADRSLLEAAFTRGSDGWQAEFGIVVKT